MTSLLKNDKEFWFKVKQIKTSRGFAFNNLKVRRVCIFSKTETNFVIFIA